MKRESAFICLFAYMLAISVVITTVGSCDSFDFTRGKYNGLIQLYKYATNCLGGGNTTPL